MSRSEHYEALISRDADGRIIEIELSVTDLEGVERLIRVDGTRAAHAAGPANIRTSLRALSRSSRLLKESSLP